MDNVFGYVGEDKDFFYTILLFLVLVGTSGAGIVSTPLLYCGWVVFTKWFIHRAFQSKLEDVRRHEG